MKSWLLIILLIMSGNKVQATMEECHSQGKSLGQSLKESKPTPKTAQGIPDYQGKNVPQASLKAKDLALAAQSKAKEDLAAQTLEVSESQRLRFSFDPENDPLFTSADQIVNNPETQLNLIVTETNEESKKTIHTCREGKNETQRSCTANLIPIQDGVREEVQIQEISILASRIINHSDKQVRDLHFTGVLATHPEGLSRLQKNIGYQAPSPDQLLALFKRVYQGIDEATGQPSLSVDHIQKITCIGFQGPTVWVNKHTQSSQYVRFRLEGRKQVSNVEMIWKSTCEDLEQLVDEGKCEYKRKLCTQGPQTRIIDGVPIPASCWQEQIIYSCPGETKDTCKPLRQQGCFQISSRCVVERDGECQELEQTLECVPPQKLASTSLEGEKPFCLDGDCVEQGWAPNPDMADSLSKLAIFKHIQKDMDAKAQTVFKGKDLKCNRTITNFKDCCVKKGWGMDVGLAGCTAQEKDLAEQCKSDKCIRVGTYCSEKVLGKCVRKKTSFCCFASKLARIIHEQGRQQLGLNFGSGKHPQCQGLTLDQITKIDFSKIDLSELFKDLLSSTKVPAMSRVTQGIGESMRDRSRFHTDKEQNITQGRSHGNF